jgi:protein disulfide-isomerase
MKNCLKSLAILVFFAFAWSAAADDTFDVLTVGENTYTNATVTDVTATDIYFTYNGGMGNAKIKDLSPELQAHFHYNEANAKTIETQQAWANAKYHALVISQAPAKSPDESRQPDATPSTPPAPSTPSDAQWTTDFPAALNQAQSGNKLVLLNFTGSDWCPWCIKLDHDVLSTSEFAAYAQNKLVLVRLDFPRQTPQSDALKQANADLASRFNVNGYPTCILVDASGKELGRQVGYLEGGPEAFIAEMNGFSGK